MRHRLDLLEQASSEILLSAYEVGDDLLALHILAKLRAAAGRGVNVKLLVDGHGRNNLIPKPLMAHLIDSGVQIFEHQPDVRYKLEIGRQRMHDKLLIVDGLHLIIGGRNVRADYFGMAEQLITKPEIEDQLHRSCLDREMFLTGPAAECAREYFLARWHAGTSGQPTLTREEKRKNARGSAPGQVKRSPDRSSKSVRVSYSRSCANGRPALFVYLLSSARHRVALANSFIPWTVCASCTIYRACQGLPACDRPATERSHQRGQAYGVDRVALPGDDPPASPTSGRSAEAWRRGLPGYQLPGNQ